MLIIYFVHFIQLGMEIPINVEKWDLNRYLKEGLGPRLAIFGVLC